MTGVPRARPSPPLRETGVNATPGHGSSPDIPTHCPRPGGEMSEKCRGTRLREVGDPLPGPHPPWRYSHGPLSGGEGRGGTGSGLALPPLLPRNRRQHHPRARLSPGYRKHCPRPREGAGEERRRRGRGGGCRRSVWVSPAGRRNPLPGPHPRGDIHHGSLHGEIPGKNRVRAGSSRSPEKPASAPFLARLSPGYRQHCPRPRVGAGEERRRRGRGGGLPESGIRVSHLHEGRAGCRRSVWVSHLHEARAG